MNIPINQSIASSDSNKLSQKNDVTENSDRKNDHGKNCPEKLAAEDCIMIVMIVMIMIITTTTTTVVVDVRGRGGVSLLNVHNLEQLIKKERTCS